MNLLMVSYCLPPLLNPQSFQIGRLLYHLPPQYKMYTVTAADDSFQKDPNLYSDLHERFAEAITIDNSLISRAAKFRLPGIYLSWHIRAYREIIKKWGKKQFDCIVTFSHPIATNLLGMWLKRFFKIRWIAFLSDPWVDNQYMNYKGIRRKINLYFERKVMETADTLVFTCPETHNFYMKKYPFVAGKSTFLEHSYDPNLYGNIKGKVSNKIIMRHIGALYGDRRPWMLLTALKQAIDTVSPKSLDILFEFIGHVDNELMNTSLKIMGGHKLSMAVKFKSPVSYLESLKLMEESDVLVVIDLSRDDNISLLCKTIDYLGSRRPILAIAPPNGATARVIKKVGGWLVAPNNADGMVKAVSDILDNYKNGTLQQFSPSTEMAQEYSISRHIDKFINILNGKTKE